MNKLISNEKEKKLRTLLKFLIANNRFYYEVWKKVGFDISNDIIEDIYESLPIVTKKDIINNKDILSCNMQNEEVFKEITSGSSGEVMTCYKTSGERARLALNIWKQRRNYDRQVNISNFIDLFSDEIEEIIGSFYSVDNNTVIKNFYKVMDLNPRWLSGPSSLISKFSNLINEERINYKNDGSLKYIELNGEYNDAKTRELIENAFQCKTINNYGTRETWCVAYECDRHKLHVKDYMIVDSIKGNQHDKFLLTSLNNYYMPIIKYSIGDLGKVNLEKCECGNKNNTISMAGGREFDIITGSNILGNYFFDQIIWGICERFNNAIVEFQVHQRELEVFEFMIVKGNNYNKNVEDYVLSRMKNELNQNINVIFKFVDHLNALKNGKLKKFYPYK